MIYKMFVYAIWIITTFGLFISKDATFLEFCFIQGIFALGTAHVGILCQILDELKSNMEIEIEEDESLNELNRGNKDE